LSTPAAAAPPRLLENAKLTTRAVPPSGLESELRALGSGDAVWAAYAVPGIAAQHVCCFESIDKAGKDAFCCGGCRLETEGAFFETGREKGRQLERGRDLFVFYRLARGTPSRIRVFSEDCSLDAGGAAVVWLTGVSAEESVAYLSRLVRRDFDEDGLSGKALTALALHEGNAAEAALKGFVGPGHPFDLRKSAAFWLGSSHGRAGYDALKSVVGEGSSPEFRREATFAFSESPVPEAIDTLVAMARDDSDGEVRGQALFWLAQKAGEKATATIDKALRDDPDDEVRVKAVFALSQLPKDEGIPRLIRLARSHQSAEVREQAFFWLGQSRDRRALDFIEDVLTR
ncbi:MAG TPA: HEAT repeat domain-containing protein, partial [Thermoanaerobaculia bacterium]|nr:HEAT repeat domain-containing protein [Thermoanaerobaculia bacterium]